MSKHHGATDAFQEILQKVDETFIQAQFYFRNLRDDTIAEKTVTKSEHTKIASPVQSERSCSPVMPRRSSSTSISRTSSSAETLKAKTKALVSLDKKQAVILTSFKSNKAIPENDVKDILKLINDKFNNNSTSSTSSSSSSASFMTL